MPSSSTPSPTVQQYSDLDALSKAAARDLTTDIRDTLQTKDRYTLALAGGSTPRRLYELLASEEEGTLPWSKIHLFWGDERYVPHSHPKSNVRLVADTLTNHISIPDANVHPIPTPADRPEAAATAYTNTLHQYFPDRSATFDTALLGLGTDGHTASLFPETGSPEQRRTDGAWVRTVTAPSRHEVPIRLTCTVPTLNGARRALFLVAGRKKRNALAQILDRTAPTLPAAQIQPRESLLWYVDAAAYPTAFP